MRFTRISATFVYLYRDVRQTLSSMIEAWHSCAFRTYPELPGWTGHPWSLLLIPGWQRLIGLPLPQIIAQQWATTTELLLDDLSKIPRERVRAIDYGDFLASPQATVESLASSLDLCWDRPLGQQLPLSATTVSQPKPDKWRAIEGVIEAIWPAVEKADAKARAIVESLR